MRLASIGASGTDGFVLHGVSDGDVGVRKGLDVGVDEAGGVDVVFEDEGFHFGGHLETLEPGNKAEGEEKKQEDSRREF